MSTNTTRVNNPMKVITGPDTRWSYANVWEPKSINGGTPKYSVSLIIPKSDTKTVAKIKAAIEAAYQEGQSKLKGNSKSVPPLAAIKTPLRDGDIERPDDPAYAQEESRSASENQKWRIKCNFEEGIPWNGVMLGYRLKNGRYEIIPEEADLVRRIYNEYLFGDGYLTIAKRLNEDGIPSRFGKQWGQSVISKILSNYTYTGNLILQKTFRENHITKKTIINNGELPKYHAEDAHDAIIDMETFQAVQAEKTRRAARFLKKPAPKKAYPFTSLLVCDGCGKNYRRKVTKTGPVWVCGTFNSMGKAACASKQIPEETLQAVTAEVLGQMDFPEELLRRLIKSILVCNGNVLIFRFFDGSEITRTWQDRSRRQSWTDEMKATARQKALERRNQNA